VHLEGEQDRHPHEPLPREEGIGGEFEKVWPSRDSRLAKVPGFVEFHLLKWPEHEDFTLYASHSIWQSRAAFEAWTRSAEFRAAHKDAARTSRSIGHLELEGFEVRQTVRRGATAVA
jgi:heme-degrading monooxygenase HmoA